MLPLTPAFVFPAAPVVYVSGNWWPRSCLGGAFVSAFIARGVLLACDGSDNPNGDDVGAQDPPKSSFLLLFWELSLYFPLYLSLSLSHTVSLPYQRKWGGRGFKLLPGDEIRCSQQAVGRGGGGWSGPCWNPYLCPSHTCERKTGPECSLIMMYLWVPWAVQCHAPSLSPPSASPRRRMGQLCTYSAGVMSPLCVLHIKSFMEAIKCTLNGKELAESMYNWISSYDGGALQDEVNAITSGFLLSSSLALSLPPSLPPSAIRFGCMTWLNHPSSHTLLLWSNLCAAKVRMNPSLVTRWYPQRLLGTWCIGADSSSQ